MNFWNKIVFGTKYLFCGFESASDYLLIHVNKYLSKTNVAEKIQQVKKVIDWVLKWMGKLQKYCPEVWREDFQILFNAFMDLSDALADGQLSKAEIQAFVEGVHIGIERWMKD